MESEDLYYGVTFSKSQGWAIIICSLGIFVGFTLTDIPAIDILFSTVVPTVMIFTPWLWTFDVLRKSFFNTRSPSYVIGVGWGWLIIHTIIILSNVGA